MVFAIRFGVLRVISVITGKETKYVGARATIGRMNEADSVTPDEVHADIDSEHLADEQYKSFVEAHGFGVSALPFFAGAGQEMRISCFVPSGIAKAFTLLIGEFWVGIAARVV